MSNEDGIANNAPGRLIDFGPVTSEQDVRNWLKFWIIDMELGHQFHPETVFDDYYFTILHEDEDGKIKRTEQNDDIGYKSKRLEMKLPDEVCNHFDNVMGQIFSLYEDDERIYEIIEELLNQEESLA